MSWFCDASTLARVLLSLISKGVHETRSDRMHVMRFCPGHMVVVGIAS